MSEGQVINPQIVHDAAANLFWMLAECIGITNAAEAVIDSAGRCLLGQPFTAAALNFYAFERLQRTEQIDFSNAITAEAYSCVSNGQNMNGVIYGDDAQTGRSPSAQAIQVASLMEIPRRVSVEGESIEKIGSLCLRHPLPAVVFSSTLPRGGILEVADTDLALGFHLPMFLTDVSTQPLGESLFVSTGVFLIPVPNARCGDLWGGVIQNSTRFVNEIGVYAKAGKSVVNVRWGS